MQHTTRRYSRIPKRSVFNYKERRARLEAAGYTFLRADSDTEAVLQLHRRERPECLKKLRGLCDDYT
ncbi:hypothetical protein [Pontibacter sp. HJ8]